MTARTQEDAVMEKEYRAVIRVNGSKKLVHASQWASKKSAEHAAMNHRAMIRDRGWPHTVGLEERDVAATTRRSESCP